MIPIQARCLLFLLATGLLISCSKDSTPEPKTQYTLSATANGGQEVPAVATQGSGTLTGSYNSSTNALSYTLTWSSLSGHASLMHFHGPALAGVNAGVALAISGFASEDQGSYSGSATLTEEQEADLLAGKWYWNVHTPEHAGGEIRGQVTAN